jgi:hypothetical protein
VVDGGERETVCKCNGRRPWFGWVGAAEVPLDGE